MHETNYTSFQIKPNKDNSPFGCRNCVFRNDAFDLDDIFFISAVGTLEGMNYYTFDVQLGQGVGKRVLSHKFATKSEALRSQRELCRAYTMTQEFAAVKEEVDGA